MRKRIDCCRDCERRKQNCHATCEEYINQSQELDELRNAMRSAKVDYTRYVYYKHNSIQRKGKKIKQHVKGSGWK